jgi:hypothetical protein
MLSVTYKPFMVIIIMLNVVILSGIMLSVVAPLLKGVSLGLHSTHYNKRHYHADIFLHNQACQLAIEQNVLDTNAGKQLS